MLQIPFHPAVADWFSARFPAPTPVQAQAWPAIHARQHALLAAPTGSGKTLAFALPLVEYLRKNNFLSARKIQAIILTPTRELAI